MDIDVLAQLLSPVGQRLPLRLERAVEQADAVIQPIARPFVVNVPYVLNLLRIPGVQRLVCEFSGKIGHENSVGIPLVVLLLEVT